VKTQFGYHIIKVESHDTTPLAEVRETLEKEEKQKLLQAKIDEIKTKANPTFNTSYFGEATAPEAPAAEGKPVTK
jgi:parvulin-like peptidyl-prolyl isomerase